MEIQIVVGSVLGASEYVAESLESLFKENEISCSVHLEPNIKDIDLKGMLLIVTSTHGAGELPDNIQEFAEALKQQDLSKLKVIIIGLGDSSYDTFCAGAETMHQIVSDGKAMMVFPSYQIDVLHHPIPEDIAVEWMTSRLTKVKKLCCE